MALFKNLRGKRENLPAVKTDGYAYFCTDDGTFWIDYKDDSGVVQRKQINAKDAETLTGASLATILNASEVEIPTSQAILNKLENYAQTDTVVSYITTQDVTDEQQAVARTNISAAKSTIVQVSDTEPTDESTEIWINTAEDWEDNAAAKVHTHDEYIEAPTVAAVGQMIRVANVDDNNKPTSWEAFDYNYEEWTFKLEDGTAVTKQVVVSA